MAQPPAVVIIARHGMRLDAADQSWHLSTPTPYDPPLTYGGWNQCRTLGVRIASILHAREQSINSSSSEAGDHGLHRRRRRKQKVVIHSSPFLRCLQTSTAIAAGMAQFEPPNERPTSGRAANTMHSFSPRLRGRDGGSSPALAPISEPRLDLAKDLARRRALGEHRRFRKAKLRVDAFLGEWLNPQYFDHITPPPPSAMMLATAKVELMQNETVDIFTPTLSHKSSGGSLWAGSTGRPSSSREGPLDDWSHVTDALKAPGHRRERSNSTSSVGSNDSHHSSGRKSPFRGSGYLQPLTSNIPKPEVAIYRPPTPSYAISTSDLVPRGYISHARNATVSVDYQWDSSRPPLDWGDGGELGEEWSSMHKRFRKGFNKLIQWYSQHNADDRGEDALGFEQADRHHDHDEDEQEELVVILVTHGAGSNALIGALTNQPVLLDVGMASLTMATRKENAPPLLSPSDSNAATPSPAGTPVQSPDLAPLDNPRRRNMDIGLSAIYDMKLVSSSEHLRPGADPTKAPTWSTPANVRNGQEAMARYKQLGGRGHTETTAGLEPDRNSGEPVIRRSNTSTAIGSIRRPNSANPDLYQQRQRLDKTSTLPAEDKDWTPPIFTTGLWTPPSGRGTPQPNAKKEAGNGEPQTRPSPGRDMMLNFANSPPASRPASSNGNSKRETNGNSELDGTVTRERKPKQQDSVIDESVHDNSNSTTELPQVSDKLPQSISRGLSQRGLWGNRPSGDKIVRHFADSPKRRWSVSQHD